MLTIPAECEVFSTPKRIISPYIELDATTESARKLEAELRERGNEYRPYATFLIRHPDPMMHKLYVSFDDNVFRVGSNINTSFPY